MKTIKQVNQPRLNRQQGSNSFIKSMKCAILQFKLTEKAANINVLLGSGLEKKQSPTQLKSPNLNHVDST